MKVKLDTIEITDEDRRTFRRSRGLTGLATRDEVRTALGGAIDAEVGTWYDDAPEED